MIESLSNVNFAAENEGGAGESQGTAAENNPAGQNQSGDEQRYRADIAPLKAKFGEDFQKIFDYAVGKGKSEVEAKFKGDLESTKKALNESLTRLKEFQALQTKYQATEEEKKKLAEQIAELEKKTMTAAELEDRRRKAEAELHQKTLKQHQEDSDWYKGQLEKHLIESAIMEAASMPNTKAFNPRQIVNLLAPQAQVEEVTNGDAKHTGKYKIILKLWDAEKGDFVAHDFQTGWKVWAEDQNNNNLFLDRLTAGSDTGEKRVVRSTGPLEKRDIANYEAFIKNRPKISKELRR